MASGASKVAEGSSCVSSVSMVESGSFSWASLLSLESNGGIGAVGDTDRWFTGGVDTWGMLRVECQNLDDIDIKVSTYFSGLGIAVPTALGGAFPAFWRA